MEKDNKSSVPAVIDMSNITLEQAPKLLENIRKQIATLRPESASTSDMLKKDLGAGMGKLQDLKKGTDLIFANASVIERERLFNDSKKDLAKTLKMEAKDISEKFLIAGSTSAEWKAAIADRYSAVKNETALKKLEAVEEFLKGKVTKEQKFSEEFKELFKGLSIEE